MVDDQHLQAGLPLLQLQAQLLFERDEKGGTGTASGEAAPRHSALALAGRIGQPLVEFPGGNSGYALRPRALGGQAGADRALIALISNGGEGGIRTPGRPLSLRRFSKPLLSTTQPPLQR